MILTMTIKMILSNDDNDIENNNNCNHKNNDNINDDKASLQLEVRYRFDEPHDAFEVYFFIFFNEDKTCFGWNIIHRQL